MFAVIPPADAPSCAESTRARNVSWLFDRLFTNYPSYRPLFCFIASRELRSLVTPAETPRLYINLGSSKSYRNRKACSCRPTSLRHPQTRVVNRGQDHCHPATTSSMPVGLLHSTEQQRLLARIQYSLNPLRNIKHFPIVPPQADDLHSNWNPLHRLLRLPTKPHRHNHARRPRQGS